MTHDDDDDDARLQALLRATAPPERDPLFRLKVLEKRAQQQFRTRVLALAGAVLAATACYVSATVIGGPVAETIRIALIGAGAAAAALLYASALLRLLR